MSKDAFQDAIGDLSQVPSTLRIALENLLARFGVDRMRPEEQATFLLEFGRLAADRSRQSLHNGELARQSGNSIYLATVESLISEMLAEA